MSYILIEQQYLATHHRDGLKPNRTRIGFLDFLREVKDAGAGLPANTGYFVVGLEQALYFSAGEKAMRERASFFHQQLQSNASLLQKKHLDVQIIFSTGKLISGDVLYCDYRNTRLPINLIFGNPSKYPINADVVCYQAAFNLTS